MAPLRAQEEFPYFFSAAVGPLRRETDRPLHAGDVSAGWWLTGAVRLVDAGGRWR